MSQLSHTLGNFGQVTQRVWMHSGFPPPCELGAIHGIPNPAGRVLGQSETVQALTSGLGPFHGLQVYTRG